MSPRPILDCFALASLGLAMTGMRDRHCEAAPLCPSLRGGEAAEAIQAGRPSSHGREACRVAAPLLDCFARASRGLAMTVKGNLDCFALASLALAMTGNKGRSGSQ